MLARRYRVYNVGLKVDVAREILTVIMTSNNVCLCKDTHEECSGMEKAALGQHKQVSQSVRQAGRQAGRQLISQ